MAFAFLSLNSKWVTESVLSTNPILWSGWKNRVLIMLYIIKMGILKNIVYIYKGIHGGCAFCGGPIRPSKIIISINIEIA